jgi:excisionase family DNA binding protein
VLYRVGISEARIESNHIGDFSMNDQENLLTPAEVAILFRVDPKTVSRWAKAGKLTSIRTLGGHRRYKESEVKELLKATTPNQSGGN